MNNKKNRPGKLADTSGIDPHVLSNWIQQDKVRWNAIKCQALIALSEGVSLTEVCKVLNVTRESVRLWRITLKNNGLQGLVADKKKGKVSGLTMQVKKDLQKVIRLEPLKLGYNNNKWTGKLICRYLNEKWKMDIAVRTAQNWMKSIQNM
ncbi:MAG: helix-turn-helix domain-containing protein [Salinivirgaceae bacterium]|jgi:transposase|nr:helix-turn-helix domain-containing protein [Salinivirgaceae bacterium]